MIVRGREALMGSWFGLFGFAFSPESGVWWLGVGRARVLLRAPRNRPLFSEIYGGIKTFSFRGWRVQFRTVPHVR